MNFPRTPLALAGVVLLALGGAALAKADDQHTPAKGQRLVVGAGNASQPETMEQFLTAVTKDVDAYWTGVFKANGLQEPRVSYDWIPAGRSAAGACDDGSGAMGDSAAAYCPGDDTITISQKFATDIYTGALDHALPGSSQGYGRAMGDFAVAYIVAHEYGHQIQDELGTDQKGLPVMSLELQADCYAGNWARSAADQSRLDDGDVDEAIEAALAVGDFDAADPGHHGTPEQRAEAWQTGFQAGDPSACNAYVS